MKYANLGRSGLRVSRFCLGTMNFGEFTEEKESLRIMDEALDLGINFFDTANIYGGRGKGGITEEILGRWFKLGNHRRERVVLATKVYGGMGNKLDGPNDVGGLSAYKIERHLNRSLSRLQTDHVELYQMHHIDRSVSWEELWGAFELAIHQGKVTYIGSSNFAGWHLAIAQSKAKERGFLGLVSEQTRYSLICRNPELEVLPAARNLGIGVIPWGPLGGGVLGGNVFKPDSRARRNREAVRKRAEGLRSRIEAYEKLCAQLGESPADVALAWLLDNPAVTAPIIGPRSVEQLRGAMRALEIELGEEEKKRLDDIFPGPGGPAPEAYAW
jgi:aryl-alcohol dehydrogenase-like predicted oxidoreductase